MTAKKETRGHWIEYLLVALGLGVAAYLLGSSHIDEKLLSRAKKELPRVHQAIKSGNAICPGITLTNLDSGELDELFVSIFEASESYGVEPELLLAVASVESRCRSTARSHKGAMGVMQLMPATAIYLGVDDPHELRSNVLGGAKYLSSLLKRYKGSTRLALAAYNAGPSNVSKHKGVPPYAETQKYIRKVMAIYSRLKTPLPNPTAVDKT